MSSEWELDEGIKSIKSAWRREHTARANLEKMLEQAEAENAKLRELCKDMMVAWWACDKERCPRHDKRCEEGKFCAFDECARDLGIEVDE